MDHTALTGGVLAVMLTLQPAPAAAQTVPGTPATNVGSYAYFQEQYRQFEWLGIDSSTDNTINYLGNWNAANLGTATLLTTLPTNNKIIDNVAPGVGWVKQELYVTRTDQRITDYTGTNGSSPPRFTSAAFLAQMPQFARDMHISTIDIRNGGMDVDPGKTVYVSSELVLWSQPGIHSSTQNGVTVTGNVVSNYRTFLLGNVNTGGMVNTGTIQATGLYNYSNGNRGEVFISGPSEIGLRLLAQGNTDIIFSAYSGSTNYTAKQIGLLEAATGKDMALKAGEGTFVYTGTKSLAMTGFSVVSGTLQIGDGGTAGELPVDTANKLTLASGTRVVFNRSDDFTVGNVIEGAGGLTKQGAGILTLTGVNTYTGSTIIEAGTLKIGTGGALSASSLITVNSGATFDFGAISDPTVGSLGGTGGSLTGGTGNLTVQMGNGTTDTYSGTNPFGGFNSLILSGDGTLNLSGDLSGSKPISINGGTLNLTGNNTLTGGITVNGKLIIGSNTAAGGAGNSIRTTGSTITLANGVNNATPVTIASNTTKFEVAGTDSAQQSGVISEDQAGRPLEKIGTGTLVLGNGMSNPQNTFSGAFTVSAGTVAIQSSRNLGSDTATNRLILNGGTLDAGNNVIGMSRPFTIGSNGGTLNHSQMVALQGAGNVFTGQLTKKGGGVLVLTEAASGAGGIFVESGALSLGHNAAAGTGTLTMNGGSTLRGRVDGMTIANNVAIQGKGGVTLERDFAGVNYTISGNISGNSSQSSLLKAQDGTINLTGNNTFQGGVTLTAGTLGVGSNTALGTGTLSAQIGTTLKSVANNLTLANNIVITQGMAASNQFTVDTNGNNMTLSGVISTNVATNEPVQPGLTKNGAGNLTLTGTNTYRGATLVNAGKLIVNGSIANTSSVTIANGAVLGGNSAIPNLTVLSGAMLSPGNSIGTTNIAGNLALNSGSTTVIEIQQAQSDRIVVGGTAQIAGTLQLVALGGPYVFSTPYTIITATGGSSGTFATINTDSAFGVGVTSTVQYGGNSVQVVLNAAPIAQTATTLALTRPRNVYAVASAMDWAVANGADASPYFNVYNQPTREALALAVNTLSGEVHTAANAIGVNTADQFLRIMLDPLAIGRDGALLNSAGAGAVALGAPDWQTLAESRRAGSGLESFRSQVAVPSQRFAAWGAVYGQSARRDGEAANVGSSRLSSSDGHIAFGADVNIVPGLVAGVAVSGGQSSASLGNALGSAQASVYQTGLYMLGRFGNLSFGASASYGAIDTKTTRSIPVLNLSALKAEYKAESWNGRAEAAYVVARWSGIGISPTAAIQVQSVRIPRFAEINGASGLAAGVISTGRVNTTIRSELGVRFDYLTMVGGSQVNMYARLGWAHYMARDAAFSASLIGLTGSAFTIDGAKQDRNAGLATLGADTKVNGSLTLGARFDTEISSNARKLSGSARANWAF